MSEKLSGFGAYQMYVSLKFYFSSRKDSVKPHTYNTSAKQSDYTKRRDKSKFEKLAEKYSEEELQDFFVSNYIYGNFTTLFGEYCDVRYKKWKKFQESRTYAFTVEIRSLYDLARKNKIAYNEIFNDGTPIPLILNEFLGGGISIDTFNVLDSINNVTERLEDNVLTRSTLHLAKRYRTFMKVEHFANYKLIEQQQRDRLFS